MADKKIKFKVTSDSTEAENGFAKVESKANALGSTLGKLGLAFGALEIAQFGMKAIKASAELEVLQSNFVGTTKDIELFRKATAGTVADASLLKLSNYASELNLSLEQQAIAFSLAEDAADKFGGTVEEGFNKFVLASEGSKKALKGLGISQAEYKKAIDEILKTTGYRIEQLDLESQAEVRKEAILKASGLTIDDVNKKTQDNADKIESLSVAWTKLETAIGGLLNSSVVIKFFELTSKAVEGWAFMLSGGGGKGMASANINSSPESDLEVARAFTKMSTDGLEISKRLITQKMQEQVAVMAVNGAMSETFKTANAIGQRYQHQLEVIKDIDKWKAIIAEKDKEGNKNLQLSTETLLKQAEAQKKITEEYLKRSVLTSKDALNKPVDPRFSIDEKYLKRKLGIDKTIDFTATIDKPSVGDLLDFTKGEQELIDFTNTITYSLTDTLQSGFSQAWEKIFGEANSLVEQLLANLANGLMNLAAQKASSAIFDFILNTIGAIGSGGATLPLQFATGAFRMKNVQTNTGNTTTVIKIGDSTVLKLVNGVLPQAYNDSVRYREIGVTA